MSRDGRVIPGQNFELRTGLSIPFTQQMQDIERVANEVGQEFTDVEPIDAQNCRVRQYLTTAFANYTLQLKSGEPIPARFAALLSTNSTTETSIGDVVSPTPLGNGITGVIESSSEESKKHEVTNRTVSRTVALPLDLVGTGITKEYGGGVTTLAEHFNVTGSLETPVGGLTVLAHDVSETQTGYSYAKKESLIAGSWPVLTGTLVDRNTALVTNFTKQVVAAGATGGFSGGTITIVDPLDKWRSEKTITTIDDAIANSIFDTYPTRITVRVPDELLSIEAKLNKIQGDGAHIPTGGGAAVGSAASISLSLAARANSSASLSIELQPTYKYNSARGTNIKANEHFFFMDEGCTETDILNNLTTKLGATVHPWPFFDEEPIVFTILNQQGSISENAEIQQSVSIAATNVFEVHSEGAGHSVETGNSNTQKTFPPTIHGEITLSGTTSSTQSLHPIADVSWPLGTNWPARSAGSAGPTIDVTTIVTPTVVPATRVTSVPITGLYCYHYEIQSKEIDRAMVFALVVDMAVFV